MEKLTGIFLKVFAFFTALCFLLTLGVIGKEPRVETVVRVLDADEYTLVN